MTAPRWVEKYIGIPFVDGGRDFNGADCWGLVRLVLATERGVLVPSYGDCSAMDTVRVSGMLADHSSHYPWVLLPDDTFGELDVAVMYGRQMPFHVGLMVSKQDCLHTAERMMASVVPLTSRFMRFRSIKFFRHEKLQ